MNESKNVSKNIDVICEMIRVAPAAATGRHLEVRKQSACPGHAAADFIDLR